MAQETLNFPNGFTSWYETYFEMVEHIVTTLHYSGTVSQKREEEQGIGGLYELAKEMTDKFEEQYKGTEWGKDDDTQFFDHIETFLKKEL